MYPPHTIHKDTHTQETLAGCGKRDRQRERKREYGQEIGTSWFG